MNVFDFIRPEGTEVSSEIFDLRTKNRKLKMQIEDLIWNIDVDDQVYHSEVEELKAKNRKLRKLKRRLRQSLDVDLNVDAPQPPQKTALDYLVDKINERIKIQITKGATTFSTEIRNKKFIEPVSKRLRDQGLEVVVGKINKGMLSFPKKPVKPEETGPQGIFVRWSVDYIP